MSDQDRIWMNPYNIKQTTDDENKEKYQLNSNSES